MSELSHRTLHLLVDIQACQTEGSGTRGVGRYSRAFFSGLVSAAGQRDIFAHLATHLPVPVELGGFPESRVLRSPSLPAWCTNRDFSGGEQDTLDALALSAFMAPAKADIIHVSHIFEGFGERVALPCISSRAVGQVMSATLYDLIPLLFQDHYFQNEGFRKWYLARMAWLQQADLLLAISESSRQDAITLLGIEPWRIVTIHGGIAPHFMPPQDRQSLRRELADRYGLRERFVLYTGGDDHRKNIRGAIRGYAVVPPELRRDCQLVIVCAMSDDRKQMYLKEAQSAGLLPEDILITGFVPEKDLVAFYGACDLFVFPSLYEGLGLPVLEAMACGAPVVGGNNSSIKELIARPDALFDSASSQSIGAAIANGLRNKDYANNLREYGLVRSKDFSWKKTTKLALDAFDDAARRSRESGIQCSIQGWLPRKRLAVFTPLPPCRSGIADYNARFLPYLARHFDIDLYVDNYKVADEILTSSFRIYNAQDIEGVARQYDAILYEFGNSEFHTHMLSLLERYPGIVGLHDAFLSGLFGHLDFNLGMGSYANEMLSSHGSAARCYFAPVQKHPNANGAAMVQLPCTKGVIDHAIGLISHSPFNLDIARLHYQEGWQAPYRIIPQMVPIPQVWSNEQRVVAREKLGFDSEALVVTSFGHIAWTKWGDRLLEAFLKSTLRDNKNVHLVFAGELAKDDFGLRLNNTIQKSGYKNRVRITGFLSDQDYAAYLYITDVSVQLRTKSRGGTPKGVLDCLAYGVPVIVNNDASYTDYPDDVVVKLSADPSLSEISQTLESICSDSQKRKNYADSGLRYVQKHHDPPTIAATYAAAINEFITRHQRTQIKNHIPALAPHLAGCKKPDDDIQMGAAWLTNLPNLQFKRRKLIIDVSYIAEHDSQTGVSRVVKQLVREMYCGALQGGIEPVAVVLKQGSLQIAEDWLQSQGLLLPSEQQEEVIEFHPGDVLLMLDSSWSRYREFFPVFEQARISCVPIYTVVYDLLPITLEPGYIVDGGKEWFEKWLYEATLKSDGLICISKSSANELINHLDTLIDIKEKPKVGYWHLGADFYTQAEMRNITPEVAHIAPQSFLLMVGTIEPRKSHALALAAMETLWAQGHELCLCIAGKEGWLVEDLMENLRNHPLAGSKLILIEHPTDECLNYLYTNAAGLLFISKGEGFGLPLVEAAKRGTPVICSDIAVFREIAGDFATYVKIEHADVLSCELADWWNRKLAGQLPDTKKMPLLNWEQSAGTLLKVIFDHQWIKE